MADPMNSDEQSKVERVEPNPKRCDEERVESVEPIPDCTCHGRIRGVPGPDPAEHGPVCVYRQRVERDRRSSEARTP